MTRYEYMTPGLIVLTTAVGTLSGFELGQPSDISHDNGVNKVELHQAYVKGIKAETHMLETNFPHSKETQAAGEYAIGATLRADSSVATIPENNQPIDTIYGSGAGLILGIVGVVAIGRRLKHKHSLK